MVIGTLTKPARSMTGSVPDALVNSTPVTIAMIAAAQYHSASPRNSLADR